MELFRQLEVPTPEVRGDFLLAGQISDEERLPHELNGILFISWRCLYAEITHAHATGQGPDTLKAFTRAVSMIIGRLTAYGEKWKRWVIAGSNLDPPRIIPHKHHEKIVLTNTVEGDYEIHPALPTMLDALREEGSRVRRQRREQPASAVTAPDSTQSSSLRSPQPMPHEPPAEPTLSINPEPLDAWRDMSEPVSLEKRSVTDTFLQQLYRGKQ